MDENNALVPNMAKLTITYNGQQGDLPDPVPYDSTDDILKQMAAESIRQGYIPGIDGLADVNFTDFVVDRFPARADVPFNRLSIRPKTPFGAVTEETKKMIDEMPYVQMLERRRNAPSGDPMFQNEVGAYFSTVMAQKRDSLPDGAHVAASKHIGWDGGR